MNEPIADSLQGLEHTLEQVRRMALLFRQVIEAQQRGERLSDATLARYLEQLAAVEADQARMAETVRAFWAVLGQERSH
jgi:hypothetical protein